MTHNSNLVVVQSFASQAEADLAESMLQSAGIDCMVQADRAGGMRDHLAWSGFGFKVLVRDEDAADARDLLKPTPESDLVSLEIFATEDEANTALGTLLSAGILAEIQDSGPAGSPPALSLSGSNFRLLVRREDAAVARELLKPPSEKRAGQTQGTQHS